MLKTLRKFTLTVTAVLALAVPMVAPAALVGAQTTGSPTAPTSGPDVNTNLSCGANLQIDSTTGTCDTTTGTSKIQSIITTGINIFSVIVGIVAVVMIIIGGFKYITSGGDSSNVSSAKNTIIYAVIGLVVVALAQFFVQFVLNKVTQ
jgi:hypothetical protein